MAWIGGPDVYRGKAFANVAAARYARMLIEGARWQSVTGICPWVRGLPEALVSCRPRAVFVREYDNCFFPGATMRRTVRIFNDGHATDPLTLQWSVLLDGETVASGEKTYSVPPGHAEEDAITASLPRTDIRLDGELRLALRAGGETVFEDAKPVSVLPVGAGLDGIDAGALCVFDPSGAVSGWLDQHGVEFVAADSPAAPAMGATVFLVGPNALTEENTTGAVEAIRAFVDGGGTVLVLEQEHVLQGEALPVDGIGPAGVRPDRAPRPEFLAAGGVSGRIAFPVAVAHPVLEGLTAADFFTWADDELTYRVSYATPASGAITVIQAGNELNLTPMMDIPVGRGGYLLSQMLVGSKLGVSPVADRLLANMVRWGGARASAEPGEAVACLAGDAALGTFLDEVGLTYSESDSPAAAVQTDADIVVARATPDALAELLRNREAVRSFCRDGGWLMLAGVDEAGLPAFSELVGVEHRLRPFRREAVLIDARTDPLLMGLSDRDVNMISDQVLASWMNLNWVSDITFSGVVDAGPEIASFAQFANDYLTKVANGLTNDDFWQYICYFGEGEQTPVLELPFDRPETFTDISIWTNESYTFIKDIEVLFDDDEANALSYTLEASKEKQDLEFEPRTASKITIRMLSHHPSESGRDLMGIDLIRVYRQLSDGWVERVVQLTNPGGLVKYPIGEGGIVLNQIDYTSPDTDENRRKKLAVYSNMLRNMGAAFAR
jgi:hypothetical protein